ncbi:MAG: hypothetical protein ABW110_09025 [Steroidobacteraceae bacterium]
MSNLKEETKVIVGSAMPGVFDVINVMTRLALWIFDCIAVNIFTLIRSNFGERFMTVVNWFIGASLFSMFTLFAALAGSPKTMLWRLAWGPAVLFCFIYHRWVIRKKSRTGIVWHSYSDGISHLTKIPLIRDFVPDEVIDKWLEPGLILLLAWPMGYFDRGFSVYLAIVGVALCLRAQVNYNLQRQHYLDVRDQRIESRFMEAALAGKPPAETGGFTIAASNRILIEQEAEVKRHSEPQSVLVNITQPPSATTI